MTRKAKQQARRRAYRALLSRARALLRIEVQEYAHKERGIRKQSAQLKRALRCAVVECEARGLLDDESAIDRAAESTYRQIRLADAAPRRATTVVRVVSPQAWGRTRGTRDGRSLDPFARVASMGREPVRLGRSATCKGQRGMRAGTTTIRTIDSRVFATARDYCVFVIENDYAPEGSSARAVRLALHRRNRAWRKLSEIDNRAGNRAGMQRLLPRVPFIPFSGLSDSPVAAIDTDRHATGAGALRNDSEARLTLVPSMSVASCNAHTFASREARLTRDEYASMGALIAVRPSRPAVGMFTGL